MPKGNKAEKKKPLLEDMETEESVNYPEYEIQKSENFLLSNSSEGEDQRRERAEEILAGRKTDFDANESAWIVEYHFGKSIIPSFYNYNAIEPSEDKFASLVQSNYYDAWDFDFSNVVVEVKVNYSDYFELHSKPIYQCPYYKITDGLVPGKQYFDIWWHRTNNPFDIIENRDEVPKDWKYFRFSSHMIKNLKEDVNSWGTRWFYYKDSNGIRTKIFYLSPNRNGQLTMTFNKDILQSYSY